MAKKVIIIDDSITQLNILKSAFAQNGWETFGALSVKDGWEMIFDCAPDLIITDAIMPKIGGFQLVKAIRENEVLNNIPIVIYSILSEKNAKFYIGKNDKDYFFQKNEDISKLVSFANDIVLIHKLSQEEKIEILKSHIDNTFCTDKIITPTYQSTALINEENIEEKKEEINIDTSKLSLQFKDIYDFSFSDEKVLNKFFSIVSAYLNYDLFLVNIFNFEQQKEIVYFDIRDIILSPVFQNKILSKYKTSDSVLFKNYAPNLKMITSEEEFGSKIEFSFEYRERSIADIAFYSKEKGKWDNILNLEELKEALYGFFKARYVNKNLLSSKNDIKKEKYSSHKTEIPFLSKMQNPKNKNSIYIAIIEIINFEALNEELSEEDIDVINSKISQKIFQNTDGEEQVYKSAKDEYIIMFFAQDDKQAKSRLNFIENSIEKISYFGYSPKVAIGASNCTIEGIFDVLEAQKNAKYALDFVTNTEKTVIKNERERNTITEE